MRLYIPITTFLVLLIFNTSAATDKPDEKQQSAPLKELSFAVTGIEEIDGELQTIREVQKQLEATLRQKGAKIFDLNILKDREREEFRRSLEKMKDLEKWRKKIEAQFIIDYAAEAQFRQKIEMQKHTAYNYKAQLDFRIIDFASGEVLHNISIKTDTAALDKKQAARKALAEAAQKSVQDIVKKLGKPESSDEKEPDSPEKKS